MAAEATSLGEGKDALVDISIEVLDRIGSRLGVVIGPAATDAVLGGAIWEASRVHDFLLELDGGPGPLQWDGLRSTLPRLTYEELREGLAALLESVVALLADISGDILAERVSPFVEEWRARWGPEEGSA